MASSKPCQTAASGGRKTMPQKTGRRETCLLGDLSLSRNFHFASRARARLDKPHTCHPWSKSPCASAPSRFSDPHSAFPSASAITNSHTKKSRNNHQNNHEKPQQNREQSRKITKKIPASVWLLHPLC